MKRELCCLMLVGALASSASAEPIRAPSAAQSGVTVSAISCPVLNEDSRERPEQHDGCMLALSPEVIGVSPAHHSHPLLEIEIALLEFFGYGVLVGGIAKLLAKRSFWIWFLVGVLLRQVIIALGHLPFLS